MWSQPYKGLQQENFRRNEGHDEGKKLVCVQNRKTANAAEAWWRSESGTRCDGKAANLRCIGPLGLGKECGFYSESSEELLAGFKQGGVEGTDFCLLKIALVAVWRMNWREVNMELGNQQGGHCYNPDKWWQGLELGRWHWRWWEVGGCGKPVDWLDRGPGRDGRGERKRSWYVPPGSVLGPGHFNTFINVLKEDRKHASWVS